MAESIIFKLYTDFENNPDYMLAEMSSASLITFKVKFDGKTYIETIADICGVARHMMNLDSDLMEMYDDAGRTQPKQADILAVYRFLQKYKGRLDPADLHETFDLKEPK